ncbi:MAG TPA: hypothetical protein VFY50_02875 [Candidatus Nitrosocosmicus sp.]|nr:hypothetical protein [Candidatus Nitrosocosmicus sp.]
MKKYDKPNLLGNVKYELNNLYVEKSVALDALGKIKQFFDERKIDEYERDRLSRKYINMLDDYNKRIFQLHPILEAQEIYEYKKQLESILTEYTRRIDSRLEGMTDYPKFKNKASKIPTKKGATDLQGGGGVGVGVASDTVSTVSMPAPVSKSASELQSASENKRSPRSLIRQLKSSIINIRLGKFGEDKNKGNSAKTSDSIESAPKLDEKNTTNAIASTIDEETNEIHRTLLKIEPNLEPISQDMRSSDSDKTEKVNIDTKEIDKIQSDILKTLKRLEDS